MNSGSGGGLPRSRQPAPAPRRRGDGRPDSARSSTSPGWRGSPERWTARRSGSGALRRVRGVAAGGHFAQQVPAHRVDPVGRDEGEGPPRSAATSTSWFRRPATIRGRGCAAATQGRTPSGWWASTPRGWSGCPCPSRAGRPATTTRRAAESLLVRGGPGSMARCGHVVDERVHPHVADVLGIEGEGNAPAHAAPRAGDGEVLELAAGGTRALRCAARPG